MPVLLIRTKATKEEIAQMLRQLEDFIKVAVDVSKGILAGGGGLHADCESLLLREGSKQEDIWGADWIPKKREVRFEAMINIAPRRRNRSMTIGDPLIRKKVESTVRNLLEVV